MSVIVPFVEESDESVIATEAGHWYLPDGTPFYMVPRKTKGKYGEAIGSPRPVTIRDARPLNAVPSVTTVMGCWDKPALNSWKAKNIFEAAVGMIAADITLLDWDRVALWAAVREKAEQPREKAADRGTLLHGDIEKFLLGQEHGHQEHIKAVVEALNEPYEIKLQYGQPEKSFADTRGFGGKVDWHMRCDACPKEGLGECDTGMVIDFKSKERLDKPARSYGYINHYAQLGAYREGLGIPNARGLSVFVGVEDCKVIVLEWTQSDLRQGFEFFKHLLAAWKIDKKYWPKL